MSGSRISFGATLRSPYDVAQQARQIEALGYDVLGCGEHVASNGRCILDVGEENIPGSSWPAASH